MHLSKFNFFLKNLIVVRPAENKFLVLGIASKQASTTRVIPTCISDRKIEPHLASLKL